MNQITIAQSGNLPALGNIAFNNLAPSDLSSLISQARVRGIGIEQDPEVQATIHRFLEEFQSRSGRYSPNTMAALTVGWGLFSKWCAENSLVSLPAEVKTAERYLSHRAGDSHRNTLARDRWAIGRVHRAAGCPDPAADHRLGDTFSALVREKVMKEETVEQASALREHHLDQLVEEWRDSPAIGRRRDLALLVVAYETLLRAAEVSRIRIKHLAVQSDGSAILTIPITKTNHSGEPDKAALSRQAVNLICDYLGMAGRTLGEGDDSPLFGKVSRHNKAVRGSVPLTVQSVIGVFNRAWEFLQLGRLGVPAFTGHSARVGAAQDLAAAGCNALQIMQAGRWSSERMVIRYCRDIFTRESAMAIRRAGKY